MNDQEKTRQDASSRDTTRPDASVRDLSRYTMRPEEAALEFEKAGVPVKLRAIQRYCWRKLLVCIKVDPDTRELTDKGNGVYLIDPASVPERTKQMLERKEFAGTSGRDTTRPDASERVQTHPDAPGENGQIVALKGDLKKTKDKLFTAQIRAAASERVAAAMREDRDTAFAAISDRDRTIGV